MFDQFSPKAAEVLMRLGYSSQKLDPEALERLHEMDPADEVLTRDETTGKIMITRQAHDAIIEIFREAVEKPQTAKLRLVYSAKPEKNSDADQENDQSQDLPEGEEAK
jgi:hypothetical protein